MYVLTEGLCSDVSHFLLILSRLLASEQPRWPLSSLKISLYKAGKPSDLGAHLCFLLLPYTSLMGDQSSSQP